ncbi:MAG: peptidoglycan-binding protein [Patescibacteria group bacterium]
MTALPFFPQYLNKGSKGPVGTIRLLQLLLLAGGHNAGIVPDGDYGEQTALGVRNLQVEMGFTGDDVDGNFGPKTRAAYKLITGIDINAIPEDFFLNVVTISRPKSLPPVILVKAKSA